MMGRRVPVELSWGMVSGVPHVRARSAFSLLELTVVLAVVGVLLALAVPPFAALRNAYSVRGAMTDLAAGFSFARQSAMARRTPVALVFDTSAGVVGIRAAGTSSRHSGLSAAYGVRLAANRDSAVY